MPKIIFADDREPIRVDRVTLSENWVIGELDTPESGYNFDESHIYPRRKIAEVVEDTKEDPDDRDSVNFMEYMVR